MQSTTEIPVCGETGARNDPENEIDEEAIERVKAEIREEIINDAPGDLTLINVSDRLYMFSDEEIIKIAATIAARTNKKVLAARKLVVDVDDCNLVEVWASPIGDVQDNDDELQ